MKTDLERTLYALKWLNTMCAIGMLDYPWTNPLGKRTSLVIKTRALINHDRILNKQNTL